MSVTCAPISRHSITFAFGVSAGMKMCASIPARAAYAAKAPAALPADGTASFCKPNCFAIEMAADMPRALKLCVGFCDSSLTHKRSVPTRAPSRGAGNKGVKPSSSVTTLPPARTGMTSRYRHIDATRSRRASLVKVRAAAARS